MWVSLTIRKTAVQRVTNDYGHPLLTQADRDGNEFGSTGG
jgi:hypothetical protein